MKKGQNIEVIAGKAVFGGKCLSQFEDRALFLERALPGEKVIARITKKKKGYIEGRALEILEPSKYRVSYKCNYYPSCGGCKLLDVDYDYQTQMKEEAVLDCILRIGKINADTFDFLPIVKSPQTSGYRNKMEFTFSNHRYYMGDEIKTDEEKLKDNFSVGFHAPRLFRKIIDLDNCYHMTELMNDIYKKLRILLKESGLEAYDIMAHTGFYRHLVMRKTVNNDIMVNIITKTDNDEILTKIAKQICEEFPAVKSFYYTINRGKAAIATGDEIKLLWGDELLIDYIGKYQFEVSSNSFFQVNPSQTERLYTVLKDFAEFKSTDNVLDLYCGVGTISLFVSDYVNSVLGIEIVENAIVNAKRNAKINKVNNCDFLCGNIVDFVKDDGLFSEDKYDVILTDPPRDGMNPKVVKAIIDSKIKKIVYVSCNPSTFARDIDILNENGYKLIKAQAVDMFPNTYHVETVGLLVRQ